MTEQEIRFNKKDTYTYAEVREMIEGAMMDRARYLGFFYKVMPRELFDEYIFHIAFLLHSNHPSVLFAFVVIVIWLPLLNAASIDAFNAFRISSALFVPP